jgi:hypothetical protein
MNKFLQVLIEANAEKARRKLRADKAFKIRNYRMEAWLAEFPEHPEYEPSESEKIEKARKPRKPAFHDDPMARELWIQGNRDRAIKRWADKKAREAKEQHQDG